MTEMRGLAVGVKLREVGARDKVYTNCSVLHSDVTFLVFETERAVAEGGNVETVVSQFLVPWANINYVLLMEERT